MSAHARSSLNEKAKHLLHKLIGKHDKKYGLGCMSCTVYDTAWLAMIKKPTDGRQQWLFPVCFQYVLDSQLPEGGWPSYASNIDGILNTMAALLAILKHREEAILDADFKVADLDPRIKTATQFLQRALDDWDVASTLHVGFEILVPSLLDLMEKANFEFNFPGRHLLYSMRKSKMAKFHHSVIYSDTQTTLLHSLEGLIGLIDFDRISHHKINGSMMSSPSSTAAYLIHASDWDDDAEQYLRHVLSACEGDGKGGVPSAFPSTHFEIIWVLSTLLETGYTFEDLGCQELDFFTELLRNALDRGCGLIGFAPGVDPDVDDTSKAIKLLNLAGGSASPAAMVNCFEGASNFRTYRAERNTSFSANCNVLGALLSVQDPSEYATQIEKAIRFLCDSLWNADTTVDKWNLSPHYSMMLFAQVMIEVMILWDRDRLLFIEEYLIGDCIPILLLQTLNRTLLTQNDDGSWGNPSSNEVTSYAILTLVHIGALPLANIAGHAIKDVLNRGYTFLDQAHQGGSGSNYLWIEKVTYSSSALTECYHLAALKTKPANHAFGDRIKSIFSVQPNAVAPQAALLSTNWRRTLLRDRPISIMESIHLESDLLTRQAIKKHPSPYSEVHKIQSNNSTLVTLLWTMASYLKKEYLSPKQLIDIIDVFGVIHHTNEYLQSMAREDPTKSSLIVRRAINKRFTEGQEGPAHASNGSSEQGEEIRRGEYDTSLIKSMTTRGSKRKLDDVPVDNDEFHTFRQLKPKKLRYEQAVPNDEKSLLYISQDSKLDDNSIDGTNGSHTMNQSNTTRGSRFEGVTWTLDLLREYILHYSRIRSASFNDQERLRRQTGAFVSAHVNFSSKASSNNSMLEYDDHGSPDRDFIHLLFATITCLLGHGEDCFPTSKEKYLSQAFCDHLARFFQLKKSLVDVDEDHRKQITVVSEYERERVVVALETLKENTSSLNGKILDVFFAVVEQCAQGLLTER
ncbi:MAG: hypothetical protein Q9201_001901 [Fulgogasparrea decipioides]